MTGVFSDVLSAAAAGAFAALNSAVAAIPAPFGLDNFLSIASYLTCPLTPLALGLDGLTDLTSLDPNSQLKRLRGLVEGEIDAARRAYETTLSTDPAAAVISQVRKYEQQLRSIQFDAVSFAEATLISATVFVVCGEEEFNEGPYNAFSLLSTGFSFEAGVPATLDQNLQASVAKVAEGEAKFEVLRAALY